MIVTRDGASVIYIDRVSTPGTAWAVDPVSNEVLVSLDESVSKRATTRITRLVASFGDLSLIASVTDVTVYVVFLAVNATVVILRVREPGLSRPFRTPGAIGGIPVLMKASRIT